MEKIELLIKIAEAEAEMEKWDKAMDLTMTDDFDRCFVKHAQAKKLAEGLRKILNENFT